MMEIVLATNNRHKLREFQEILADRGITVVPLSNFPGYPQVEEDGRTFDENALKKAREIAAYTGRVTMADDSGLEVDFLDGAPGIFSARYAGEGSTDAVNNQKLLRELAGVDEESRGARFRCVIALVAPAGQERVVEGICRGRIAGELRGDSGFGYDPLFIDEHSGRTFAEMDAGQKNAISHRYRAIQALKAVLPDFLRAEERV